MQGEYRSVCWCDVICPCAVGGKPSHESGTCMGVAAFRIDSGNLDDVDLSGVSWGFFNLFPGTVTDGNWTIGMVIDEGASDGQVEALGRIASGQEGGPFGDMAALIGTALDPIRGKVEVTDAGGSIAGNAFTVEPFRGVDGNPTMMKNAMLGFAPETLIATGSGHVDIFGHAFDTRWGEGGQLDWSSESAEPIRA
ncbi:MAG TPA: DUF1326 domain-containing protein [Actinomycetota bacterium]|nr:DUF1326 domain-containing protein [Actinomycetota bacterium]